MSAGQACLGFAGIWLTRCISWSRSCLAYMYPGTVSGRGRRAAGQPPGGPTGTPASLTGDRED